MHLPFSDVRIFGLLSYPIHNTAGCPNVRTGSPFLFLYLPEYSAMMDVTENPKQRKVNGMLTSRTITLYLLKALYEYTDKDHILTREELTDKIIEMEGCTDEKRPNRKTIYDSIALLKSMGYDISTPADEENGKGYYLRTRDFEQSEILLLANAVYSFPFIPAKHSKDLIEKLQRQLSINQRKQYQNLTLVRPELKTQNYEVFYTIELLDEAIAAKRKVQFDYMKYNAEKKLVPRSDKKHIVSPYRCVYLNEHFYLFCKHDNHEGTGVYRLDRMANIEILEHEKAEGKLNTKEVDHAIYAYTGKAEQITMHCSKFILDDVLDKFGMDIHISELDEKRFSVKFSAPPMGMKYWALQYLSHVEVVEPKWLREEIVEIIQNNPYDKNKS